MLVLVVWQNVLLRLSSKQTKKKKPEEIQSKHRSYFVCAHLKEIKVVRDSVNKREKIHKHEVLELMVQKVASLSDITWRIKWSEHCILFIYQIKSRSFASIDVESMCVCVIVWANGENKRPDLSTSFSLISNLSFLWIELQRFTSFSAVDSLNVEKITATIQLQTNSYCIW